MLFLFLNDGIYLFFYIYVVKIGEEQNCQEVEGLMPNIIDSCQTSVSLTKHHGWSQQ